MALIFARCTSCPDGITIPHGYFHRDGIRIELPYFGQSSAVEKLLELTILTEEQAVILRQIQGSQLPFVEDLGLAEVRTLIMGVVSRIIEDPNAVN